MGKSFNVEYEYISLDEFKKLDMYDVNYSGILFIFNPCLEDHLYAVRKQILDNWNLNKRYRFVHVEKTGMFYVENMDIQTIDSEYMLIDMLKNGSDNDIKKVCLIGEERDYK